jgi:hypothetical protein
MKAASARPQIATRDDLNTIPATHAPDLRCSDTRARGREHDGGVPGDAGPPPLLTRRSIMNAFVSASAVALAIPVVAALPAATSPSMDDPIFAAIARCKAADEAQRQAWDRFSTLTDAHMGKVDREARVLIGRRRRIETDVETEDDTLKIVQRTFDDPEGLPAYANSVLEIQSVAESVPEEDREIWIETAKRALEKDKRRVRRARARAGVSAARRATLAADEEQYAALWALAEIHATTHAGAVAALVHVMRLLAADDMRYGGYDGISDQLIAIQNRAIDTLQGIGPVPLAS